MELKVGVSLLLKISDVYSSDASSIELFVDPWRLLCSSQLQLEKEWVITGTLADASAVSAQKRRKILPLSVPRLDAEKPTKRQRRSTSALGRLQRPVFYHQALNAKEIRLVNILPATHEDRLQGVIIHVPSTSAPVYRALSYVWGTGQQTEELLTPDGTISITISLSNALRSLCHKDRPLTLWVDAICINQKDRQEKEKQIRLLPIIFQNASYTYAFLEGGDAIERAMEMLIQVGVKAAKEERSRLDQSEEGMQEEHEIQHGIRKAYSTAETAPEGLSTADETERNAVSEKQDWPEGLPRIPASWQDDSIPHLHDEVWTCVKALFSLPYFRRVWIIQEVVAALNVKIVCGNWTIDWSDLHLAVDIVDRQLQLSETDTTHVTSSWQPFLSLASQREWEARSSRWSLSMLLEHFRYTESTLSRDRLFAMLGLASDGNEADFEPDYSSTLEEIVLRFARVFVRQGRGMQLLYRAGLHGEVDRFSSWIPDWMTHKPASLADSSEGGSTFAAYGPQQPMIRCSPDSDELMVEGYTVDEIESISESSNTKEELAQYLNEVDAMIDNAILRPTQTTCEDLKWKVPIAGALFPKVATFGGIDLRTSYIALWNSLGYHGKGKAIDRRATDGIDKESSAAYTMILEQLSADSYRDQGMSYLAALQDTVLGWRFVVTRRGYFGTVPSLTQTGDVVAIMKGGCVPFVLQRSASRSSEFRLVGECYVHGLMNGEGLSLPDLAETVFALH
jgi:hypothetical protein